MEVRRLALNDIPAIAETVSTRLLDSMEASFQLEGISDKWGLLQGYTHARIEHWHRIGEVWIIGDCKGMLAGHYRNDENVIDSARLMFSVIQIVFHTLLKEDRVRLMDNLKKSAEAENVSWRKQICKNHNYYYIDLIAVDQTLKGRGAFRKLLAQIITKMQQKNIQILLDTHDASNIPLYQHFGFDLVQEHQAKHSPNLIQYSMIKRP